MQRMKHGNKKSKRTKQGNKYPDIGWKQEKLYNLKLKSITLWDVEAGEVGEWKASNYFLRMASSSSIKGQRPVQTKLRSPECDQQRVGVRFKNSQYSIILYILYIASAKDASLFDCFKKFLAYSPYEKTHHLAYYALTCYNILQEVTPE